MRSGRPTASRCAGGGPLADSRLSCVCAQNAVDRRQVCRAVVAHAMLLGLTVSCPGCGTRTIKDDQCMHMDSCACRVSFCYVCGGKAADCPRGEGCDAQSLYLERNPGWRPADEGGPSPVGRGGHSNTVCPVCFSSGSLYNKYRGPSE